MNRKKKLILTSVILLTLSLMGCSNNTSDRNNIASDNTSDATNHATKSTVTLTEGKYSEEKLDASWDEASSSTLTFDNNTISSDDTNIQIEENTATITQTGTYILTGTLTDGQIIVDAPDKSTVKLVLNNAILSSSTSSPIYIKSGDTIITLADDTDNSVSDATEYVYDSDAEDEPDAAIFAKDDLTFNGTGNLTVTGNYNHAIQSKDALKFVSGTYSITSAGDGVVGKDSVSIKDGNYTIEAGEDGIKSTNIDETDKGYVIIENGDFQITAANDGIQAETLLLINDGEFNIQTGGGSSNAASKNDMRGGGQIMEKSPNGGGMPQGEAPDDGNLPQREIPDDSELPEGGISVDSNLPEGADPGNNNMPEGTATVDNMPKGKAPDGGKAPRDQDFSGKDMPQGDVPDNADTNKDNIAEGTDDSTESDSTKALKSYVELTIKDGIYSIDSCDDALQSNQNVTIDGGTFSITSGDDGIHADALLTINDGSIDIQQSYEGIEGFDIVIDDGNINIIASDDGINAAGDDDSASNPEDDTTSDTETTERPENTGNKDFKNGMHGGMAGEDQGAALTINGGTLCVNAEGDGLDANGSILITGGTSIIHGPSNSGNGTLDYVAGCQITGGTLLAVGSSGMAQNPDESSTQPVIVQNIQSTIEAGTTIAVRDSDGTVIADILTEKNIQWYAISSPELQQGDSYTICIGDDETTITLDSIITQIQ
ncbi:carbohydrate-binding domain-containing protein [Bariatricus sp. SGI.154]|uniref:carbohydrate-binding domain-containing protein n=1 Tax=Bariatricus sp. SGI.154 TaxID=3420549 RepID=UPI003CFEDBA9